MITFMGDIALLSNNLNSTYIPEHPYIANLEYVIGNVRELKPKINKVNLISDCMNFEDYFGSKPVALTIANNHILDYGIEGLQSTKGLLKKKE